ncbi:MAG: biotin-dependent carboxyltransferase family protein [Actinobacteria bacterium]|nr:biotin-dependent carboxyltransferase family protein [Actinomycetota bacterium]
MPGRSGAEVLEPGPSAILVDDGRSGWAHLAVTTGGAFDRPAFRLANRLVGNHPGTAVVEFIFGPLALWFHRPATVAVTGVDAAVTIQRRDGSQFAAATNSTVSVPAEGRLRISSARSGLRGYLAVRGGWDVPPVLGSRSRDTLAYLGPEPLRTGDLVPIGTLAGEFPAIDHVPGRIPPDRLALRLLPAPRPSALQLALDELSALEWTVSPASDRVGIRLRGPALPVRPQSQSEPLVRGAVQVPPDGQPVIMGPDHPTTGGYPVIGVVSEDDSDALAQARPGTPVRLVPTTDTGT